jgi:hypothetical protein
MSEVLTMTLPLERLRRFYGKYGLLIFFLGGMAIFSDQDSQLSTFEVVAGSMWLVLILYLYRYAIFDDKVKPLTNAIRQELDETFSFRHKIFIGHMVLLLVGIVVLGMTSSVFEPFPIGAAFVWVGIFGLHTLWYYRFERKLQRMWREIQNTPSEKAKRVEWNEDDKPKHQLER